MGLEYEFRIVGAVGKVGCLLQVREIGPFGNYGKWSTVPMVTIDAAEWDEISKPFSRAITPTSLPKK